MPSLPIPATAALTSSLLFASTTAAWTLVCHPAGLAAGTEAYTKWFTAMFGKVASMQSVLLMAGSGAAAVQAVRGEASPQQRGLWLTGAALLLANLPWTLLKLMPINKVIIEAGTNGKAAPREQLEAWGPLHNVRTALGTASALVMGYAAWKL